MENLADKTSEDANEDKLLLCPGPGNVYGTHFEDSSKTIDIDRGKENHGPVCVPNPSYKHEIASTVSCCFGNIAHGMAYGLASPTVPSLLASGTLTRLQVSWFESLLIVGAFGGGLCVGPLMNFFGRKMTILLAGVPFIAGWMCIAITQEYASLCAGRILTGIAYGLVQLACPVYIAETVSKELRGTFGMGVVLGQTAGTLLQYSLGAVLDIQWLAMISMLPVVFMLTGMTFMPESPRWLVLNGQKDKAIAALKWLRNANEEDDIMQEFNEIDLSITNHLTVTWSDVIRELPNAIQPVFICTMLFIFQQFSGITPVMFNAKWILGNVPSDSGLFSSGKLSAIFLAAAKLITTVIGVLLIDKLGRRPLFVGCGFIMTFSLTILGLYFYLSHHALISGFSWLPLVTLVLYVSAYSIAWGGIPWVVISELPPLQVRGLTAGVGSTGVWISAFIVTQCFMPWAFKLHLYGLFWMYGAVALAGSIFACVLLPETKLRSLEDLELEITLSLHS